MQLLRLAWALTAAAVCFLLLLLLHSQILREGQLAAGTCEIVTLDRDSSQPRRTIARQTARCACRKGQIAGTTRARPACVDVRIVWTRQWCEMTPCLDDEGCDLLVNQSGWTCTQPGGRVKTTTQLNILRVRLLSDALIVCDSLSSCLSSGLLTAAAGTDAPQRQTGSHRPSPIIAERSILCRSISRHQSRGATRRHSLLHARRVT
uniref:chemokine-like protein TAFA-5 n=1 Tax=Semicossyphus pulcher TaxID=241346 RepID=UPI0037E944E9